MSVSLSVSVSVTVSVSVSVCHVCVALPCPQILFILNFIHSIMV